MARARRRHAEADGGEAPPEVVEPAHPPAEGTTGRYLVVFREEADDRAIRGALASHGGVHDVANTLEVAGGALEASQADDADAVVFDKLGVAVVTADPQQVNALAAAGEATSSILFVEPERIMYAYSDLPFGAGAGSGGPLSADYLRGFRDAADALLRRLTGAEGPGELGLGAEAAAFADSGQATWGLLATKVVASRFSGRRVRVAVLDTGFDLQHPDFVGRTVVSQSFVAGQPVQDGHGHGTHCIGTALGPQRPPSGPRYGCAFGGDVYAGKVLSNQGSGADAGILAGINWAVTNQCRVISMSLGAPVEPGEAFSQVYETVARRSLAAGTLIVAAAGNESRRNAGIIKPVGRPANCPSILAVGAVDSSLRIADFSNRRINPGGGDVDLVGPGVDVLSSWPMPRRYNTISGTSMATPHVAGIAALWSEANGNAAGAALWQLLVRSARRLSLPSVDVGAGLVQAP